MGFGSSLGFPAEKLATSVASWALASFLQGQDKRCQSPSPGPHGWALALCLLEAGGWGVWSPSKAGSSLGSHHCQVPAAPPTNVLPRHGPRAQPRAHEGPCLMGSTQNP